MKDNSIWRRVFCLVEDIAKRLYHKKLDEYWGVMPRWGIATH